MKKLFYIGIIMIGIAISSCNTGNKNESQKKQNNTIDNFKYLSEQFADIKIMRYQVPLFDSLTLNQKILVYYLSQAAYSGRDILWDQNYKHNLCIRRTLEAIIESYEGDRSTDNWKKFITYTKQVWFANGIHHHMSMDKIIPTFSKEYFETLITKSPKGKFPLEKGENITTLIVKLTPLLFDTTIDAKRVSLNSKKDLVTNSACNFYENVTQKEVENFYQKMKNPNNKKPISYGLNSKLIKENGILVEKIYKVGGMYSAAIEKIVYWLEKAVTVAENDKQKKSFETLIDYYKTGNLRKFDEYSIQWVKETQAIVDVTNGFIEVYGDPLGLKATYESVVSFKDKIATRRAETISSNAQWFEDNSPIDAAYKKKKVKGVTAKVITASALGGDCYPSTPIGINLPNADWIRKEYGSKSVSMDNITYAYDKSSEKSGMREEFSFSKEEVELANKYSALANNLITDLHECVGHASGQLLPNTNPDAMKNYSSTLEEARADLVALYYIMDKKLVDIGVMPNLEVAKVAYNSAIKGGMLTQLVSIELGQNVEESHMRDRLLIAKWCFEKGKKDNVIEYKKRDEKTFVVINNYEKLRILFGELLKEIQRIKSEGDFEAGKALVEKYGVKIDPAIHKEIRERFAKLKIAPYGGFINPIFKPVMDGAKIIDIKIEYPDNFMEQNLYYSKNFSFLPTYN